MQKVLRAWFAAGADLSGRCAAQPFRRALRALAGEEEEEASAADPSAETAAAAVAAETACWEALASTDTGPAGAARGWVPMYGFCRRLNQSYVYLEQKSLSTFCQSFL